MKRGPATPSIPQWVLCTCQRARLRSLLTPLKNHSPFTEVSSTHTDHFEDFLQQYIAQPPPEPPLPFKLDEHQSTISQLNKKQAYSPHRLRVTALKNTPPIINEFILDVFNTYMTKPFAMPVENSQGHQDPQPRNRLWTCQISANLTTTINTEGVQAVPARSHCTAAGWFHPQ